MSRLSGEPAALVSAAADGDRVALARLLSIVERGGAGAAEVGRLAFPRTGTAYTLGITGAPGAGKSTLTSALTAVARGRDQRLAVLAVDPSSPYTGGAILGDRVRMQDHAIDPGVFIRSMATRGHLGGLALATPQVIRVLDAVGWPWVLVETVGVGQAEVEIAAEADTTVVVVNPRWGDAVQANKAGLMEVADVFVINKADRPGVDETRRDLQQMLELSDLGDWYPPIVATVGTEGEGAEELWETIGRHRGYLEVSGELAVRRTARLHNELDKILHHRISERVEHIRSSAAAADLDERLATRQIDLYAAADLLLGEG